MCRLDERRQPRDVLGQDRVTLGPHVLLGRVEVDGVPQRDAVEYQPERAKLVLHPGVVAPSQFALLAVEDVRGSLLIGEELNGHSPAK